MKINEYVKKCHQNAVKKGFYEDIKALEVLKQNNVIDNKFYETMKNNAIGNRLALIHGEASEALEELRKERKEALEVEIADIVIRCFDLSGALDIDLETVIQEKMKKNESRPFKHGKAF